MARIREIPLLFRVPAQIACQTSGTHLGNAGLSAPTTTAAISESDQARDAFFREDYRQALAQIDAALSKTPSDVVLHEFRALSLFAMQRYKESAGTLYAVLSVGPGWDWTTMSGLYPSVDVYTQQLRSLESFVAKNPDSADGHFVLAYHYMTAGHFDPAKRQLKEVVRLIPNDQVSQQLLAMISPSEAPAKGAAPAAPTTVEPEPQAPSLPNLVGNWKAPATGGGTIDLSLTADGKFKWTHARPNKTQSFDGKYQLAGNTLVLEYSNTGSMVGRVNSDRENHFSFKMVGGPPNDPGLAFRK